MFVKYWPEGSDTLQEWEFVPGKVRESRAEMIEKRYSKLLGEKATWDQFKVGLIQGNSSARRVVLWHLLSLDHVALRIEDVDPLKDELQIEQSKTELEELREGIAKSSKLDEQTRELLLESMDQQIAEAPNDGGKAPSKNSESGTP